MCGIAGSWSLTGALPKPEAAERMLSALQHRGPDASGSWSGPGVWLGHTRLSIIDIAGGLQPMHLEERDLTLSFNGEIFNHVELRQELEQLGHRFRTHSDTEVLLHAFAEWDTDCVQHLNGQWAFAIYDGHRRRLILSRDRLGIRPLYYAKAEERLLFASEISALFAEGSLEVRLDPLGLRHCFTHWFPVAPQTAFVGVQELRPGHSLIVDSAGEHLEHYWELGFDEVDQQRSRQSWAEELRALLDDATRLRLRRSDVPVGAYLSGGLDSSATVALARRHAESKLQTFSVAFEDPEYDERSFQQLLARDFHVDHHQFVCTKDEICRRFPEVVRHAGTTLLRTAPAPLFLLAERVRAAGFKVVLTGEGADEMLGGYDIFKECKIRRFWARQPSSTWRPKLLQRLYPWLPRLQRQGPKFLGRFFRVRQEDLTSPWFSHLPRWHTTKSTQLFFRTDLRQAWAQEPEAAEEALRPQLPANFSNWTSFAQAQWIESRSFLPGYLLSSQGDRMAMAASIEGRFPFLDHRIAEFASRMPPRIKMHGLDEKRVLKDAVGAELPTAITNRKKQPYRAPEANCFFDTDKGRARSDWVEELASPAALERLGIFDPGRAGRLLNKARAGRVVSPRDGMAVIALLSTQLLASEFSAQAPL
ncbi:MAG: asparagine synthase (glutamine-hydrolyzing) [Planctomycetota bacterium]|nr:MAG: asparagine synthase (glutamine-hydrolyzing) [Planctomycetota bacterium]